MNVIVEQWWNDTDRVNMQSSEHKPFHCTVAKMLSVAKTVCFVIKTCSFIMNRFFLTFPVVLSSDIVCSQLFRSSGLLGGGDVGKIGSIGNL
jgi:hypothetical protein